MYNIIRFALQDDSRASKLTSPLWLLLNRTFYKKDAKFIYSDKLNFFDIVFRISGEPDDFDGEDGPVRLKKSRGRDNVEMDFVVPMYKWQEYMVPVKARVVDKIIRWDIISDEKAYEFREYISDGVKECYSMMKVKAKKLKYTFDEKKMDEDFNHGMELFLTSPLPELSRC